MAANGTFSCTLKDSLLQPYLDMGLTVHVAMSMETAALTDGVAGKSIAAASKWTTTHGVSGLMLDYEPSIEPAARPRMVKLYASYLKSLASSLHMVSKEAGMCISSWGILDYYGEYADTSLDIMMSMAGTYFGTNVSKNMYNVQQELAAGVSLKQISIGVGSMMTSSCRQRQRWNYNWTQARLSEFVAWAEHKGVESIDVWRADIDSPGGGTECTQQFYFDIIKAFLSHGKLST